jgi:hypothetical protein
MAWTREKREAFESAFREFLMHVSLNSKDYPEPIILGEHLYDAQERFIKCVFDALENDIHDIYVLKSRQLGISTVTRALSTFYLGMHHGMKGAIVFDTAENKNSARVEIKTMIQDLPPSLGFPPIKMKGGDNREGLTLENDAQILYKSAGVKKTKSSGTLGRSVGLSLCHASEICSWDNDEGLQSFKESLSDVNPNRLYIWESTARGPNKWMEMWEEARADEDHCACLFLGWWSKPNHTIDPSNRDFERYGRQPPTPEEKRKIEEVKKRHDHVVTQGQLAWLRRKMDPTAQQDGDAPVEYVGDSIKTQEQCWLEEEAFQYTGSRFFPPESLTDMMQKHASRNFKAYQYLPGVEFSDMRILAAANTRSIELKIWEEPVEGASYIVAVDPAFGENENNDRAAIQVCRCYADGLDQVAEYAWPLASTRQTGWIAASLIGYYAGDTSTCYLFVELNGPGDAVWKEMQSLKKQIATNYKPLDAEERGIKSIFKNVRNYLYTRSDALKPGSNSMHWKTNSTVKVSIMERLRDFVNNGMLRVKSFDTLKEMNTITREGDVIKAEGSKKDDRVVALAFAVRCWEDTVRGGMMGQGRTRKAEAARLTQSVVDRAALYSKHQFDQFLAQKRGRRMMSARAATIQRWRGR